MNLLDLVPGVLEDVLEGDEILGDAAFGDVEDHALRRVEGRPGRCPFIETERGDPTARGDQPSFGGRLFDEMAVVLDIRRRWHAGLQLGKERLATNPLQNTHVFQLGGQR